ncbi:hypothetical protein PR048_000807 [Dryococelus australis]|uniref:Uncharacterized protein n=1 Tax=Dryococelus australis TaxID=614101 RepID=A0ABQ9IFL9_9NEOP|nr:hypothetical protein PR048_000807 [Dryococelus australis]
MPGRGGGARSVVEGSEPGNGVFLVRRRHEADSMSEGTDLQSSSGTTGEECGCLGARCSLFQINLQTAARSPDYQHQQQLQHRRPRHKCRDRPHGALASRGRPPAPSPPPRASGEMSSAGDRRHQSLAAAARASRHSHSHQHHRQDADEHRPLQLLLYPEYSGQASAAAAFFAREPGQQVARQGPTARLARAGGGPVIALVDHTCIPCVGELVPALHAVQHYDGNSARLARRSHEALGVRVIVALTAPSFLDLGRGVPTGSIPLLTRRVLQTFGWPMRVSEMSMEQRRSEGAGYTRENPPASGIVRRDSHMRKSGKRPGRGLNPVRLVESWPPRAEYSTRHFLSGNCDVKLGFLEMLPFLPPFSFSVCFTFVVSRLIHSLGWQTDLSVGVEQTNIQNRKGMAVPLMRRTCSLIGWREALVAGFLSDRLLPAADIACQPPLARVAAGKLFIGADSPTLFASHFLKRQDFRSWESCRTIPLVGEFSRVLPFPPPFHSGAAPNSPRFTLIGSQDLDVNNRPIRCRYWAAGRIPTAVAVAGIGSPDGPPLNRCVHCERQIDRLSLRRCSPLGVRPLTGMARAQIAGSLQPTKGVHLPGRAVIPRANNAPRPGSVTRAAIAAAAVVWVGRFCPGDRVCNQRLAPRKHNPSLRGMFGVLVKPVPVSLCRYLHSSRSTKISPQVSCCGKWSSPGTEHDQYVLYCCSGTRATNKRYICHRMRVPGTSSTHDWHHFGSLRAENLPPFVNVPPPPRLQPAIVGTL